MIHSQSFTFILLEVTVLEKSTQRPTHSQGEDLSSRQGDVPAHLGGLPEDRPLADHTVSDGIRWKEGFKAMKEAGQEQNQQPQPHVCGSGDVTLIKFYTQRRNTIDHRDISSHWRRTFSKLFTQQNYLFKSKHKLNVTN